MNRMTTESPPRARVGFHSTHRRSSLAWLSGALVLGGLPVIYVFTTPGAPVANAVFGAVVGLPLFVMSLIEVGESISVLLVPSSRKLVYVKGFFRRREAREYAYADFSRVELKQYRVGSSAESSGCWGVSLCLRQGGELPLEVSGPNRAHRCASELASALGVQAIDPLKNTVLLVPSPAPEMNGKRTATSMKTILIVIASLILVLIAMTTLVRK